ncbi:hypothetical protein ASPZODRAFT_122043 [Penicilliopsis zonata CBS 506.65]|uniref:Major facilitator superfamily (MFS) profile domain-containing protein n=1 Tax=Penicilliopsis zonata CBS 506.65 TaxID=1073090 RepID=A0A1L9S9Z5_9EURO|nr:hypothetical protein ASPZODRAFT_122043 [Penicilliopsis zonata CBS 506.65]OJJ43969.1 hypothetical protein ASPZODRAFT_122043 [Penicilliopsis zonata CBS 506.65]
MASLCLSATLSALDLTIVTTALPVIVGYFGSEAGYTWIGSAYILAYTAITPVWGSVADIWGRKPIILIALSIFLAGSLICSTVTQLDAFLVGRAVQGLGAAGMGTMVNVIISDMFSLRDRGLYLAVVSIVYAVGSAIGPIMGGVFTRNLSWRWCFWINLPIGALVFLVLFFFLRLPSPNTPVRTGLKAIDWSGSLLIVGGILMILLALTFGGVTYPWPSSTVICLLVFGTVAVPGFVLNEWRIATNPVIPLRLFSTVSKAAAYGVFFCNSYVFLGTAYYLPLYAQSVLGADTLTSGVYLLPLIVSCSLTAAAAGVFMQKTGKYRPIMHVGAVAMSLGIGLCIDLGFEKNLVKLFAFEILAGVGSGMNIEAPMIAAQAAASVRDTAAVLASMGFIRSISSAISTVVGGVVFQDQMNRENPNLVKQLGRELASKFNGGQASANVDLINTLPETQQIIVRRAYYQSLKRMWIMYVAFSGMAIIFNLFIQAHHLSSEHEAAVLGVNREEPVPVAVNHADATPEGARQRASRAVVSN